MLRELIQLNEFTYLFPWGKDTHENQPNMGVIKGQDQTVLIGSGNSPGQARHALAAMAGMDFAPVKTIIYTHHHWDQVFGAATFRPQTIIAHDSTVGLLRPLVGREWSAALLTDEMQRYPALRPRNEAILRAMPNWYNFQILAPTITFGETMALYLDRLALELVYVGGNHAPDSVVVKLPQARIMFLGACYYPKPPHLRQTDEDTSVDVAMLEALISSDYDIYIDNYGELRDRNALHQFIVSHRAAQKT